MVNKNRDGKRGTFWRGVVECSAALVQYLWQRTSGERDANKQAESLGHLPF